MISTREYVEKHPETGTFIYGLKELDTSARSIGKESFVLNARKLAPKLIREGFGGRLREIANEIDGLNIRDPTFEELSSAGHNSPIFYQVFIY